MLGNILERLWNVIRELWIVLIGSLPRWQTIRERLDKHGAKRPDVTTRRYRSFRSLGSVVNASAFAGFLRVTHRTNSIARKLQLITDRHEICRLDAAMHHPLSV